MHWCKTRKNFLNSEDTGYTPTTAANFLNGLIQLPSHLCISFCHLKQRQFFSCFSEGLCFPVALSREVLKTLILTSSLSGLIPHTQLDTWRTQLASGIPSFPARTKHFPSRFSSCEECCCQISKIHAANTSLSARSAKEDFHQRWALLEKAPWRL